MPQRLPEKREKGGERKGEWGEEGGREGGRERLILHLQMGLNCPALCSIHELHPA